MRLFIKCKNPDNKQTIKQIEKAQKSLASKFAFPSRQCSKSGLVLANLQMYHSYEIMKEWVKQATEFVLFEEVIESIKEAWRMAGESEDEYES